MARETQEDYLRGLFFDDHNDFADYYVTSSSHSQPHGFESHYEQDQLHHHHMIQSPFSKEQEEINKNLTEMNLDDIQILPNSYSAHLQQNLLKQHEQSQKYAGSPILQQQQQQNHSALQQQQAQNYYYQPGINRNYYGQMEQDPRFIEQQQLKQQQSTRYQNNYAIYPNPPNYQPLPQEHFQNPAIAAQGMLQQHQPQVPFLTGNNEFLSTTHDFQQLQQLQQQQQQPLTPPTYPFPVYEQIPHNLDSPIRYVHEDPLQSTLKYKSHVQIPIKQGAIQQPQIHQLPPEIYNQHGFQQIPGDYQNTISNSNDIRLGHYYQSPSIVGGEHPLNQLSSPQQIQIQQQQYLYKREFQQNGGDHNEYLMQHQIGNHQNDNHKQNISNGNFQRTQSGQYHPLIGQEKGASEQAYQQQFYHKQQQSEMQQQQQQIQYQQAMQFHQQQQQQQLQQRIDVSQDSQQGIQLNGSYPLRQQQYQQQQNIDLQLETKQENNDGLLPIARTSVCIPLPQNYIRNSHSTEDAGQQRLQKYHQHQIHKGHTAAGSVEHSKKLTAKEQSELKIEKKYKKSQQTNSEIKRIQRNISHKKKVADEGDQVNTEANAFKKYLHKDMHGGSNSQIEFSKDYQATKKEPESECESGQLDSGIKQSRNCRHHDDMQSSQSLQQQHHCCQYDPSEISEVDQLDMMTQSQGSCMVAEEDEKKLTNVQDKSQKQKQNEKRFEQQQNIIDNNPEDSGQQVRIRSQSSHMHDKKDLKEEELDDEDAGNEGDKGTNKTKKNQVDNSKTDEIAILADSIKHCNKKNVVKNIMSAFLTFMNDRHFRIYSEADQSCILSLYHSQQVGAATDEDDKIETIRQKFKRYIAPKSLNHYTVRLLILHPNYGPIFKYFIMNPIHKWINNSKVSDLGAHIKMIGFFLSCFQDPTILEELKRHEKKRAHFS